jgi:hypothetical protein
VFARGYSDFVQSLVIFMAVDGAVPDAASD